MGVSDPPRDQSPSRPPDSPEPLASPALPPDLAPPGHLGSVPPGSLEPLASPLAPEALELLCQASLPQWYLSCSLLLLLQWLRPWLALGGAPVFLLEVPTGSQSTLTVLPSTTLSTRSLTTSSRTTSHARSLGTVTLWPVPTTASTPLEPWSPSTTRLVLKVSSRRPASRR